MDSIQQDDRTPLHRACSNGQFNLVKKLIEEGAEIDAKDEMQWTPMIIASSAGHFEIVKYLIQKGAEINTTTINGQTALHYAASKGWRNICQLLIESGADQSIRDRLKQTPLHRANGARIDMENVDKKLPIDLCRDYQFKKLMKNLMMNNPSDSNHIS
ncbi:26S proteasome non-ATPase regulatory subunit 10-like protein [Sarcoptes scabiei]|uniref:26S proteasome non-ATPase regulatory subunit 10-like protein n=1 Tax=Sarcoptes scabiei TaxID=52283 RepID=A0A131ZYV0_SARSC|nr:26S proteasome non-ATPase regulatory subunit 10-like protein [Sarcoptes scabiei]